MEIGEIVESHQVIKMDVDESQVLMGKRLRTLGAQEAVWREMRRRWMVAGVLAAVTLAVLTPRLGVVGGALQTLAPAYVYYAAGRRAVGLTALAAHARALALCVAHAHVVAPALCAALVCALRDGLDYRLVRGVMLWSRGGGCAWLSLSMSAHRAAPGAAALVYVAALLVAPLATKLICGRASLPPLVSVLSTLATTMAPFLVGLLKASAEPGEAAGGARALRVCALVALYAECCERLCESEGALRVSDVLVTLVVEALAVGGVAATSTLYARCGVLSPGDARLVTLCALPRALDTRWEAAGGCVSAGLVRLPAVFLAPTQALLLAALVPDDPDCAA